MVALDYLPVWLTLAQMHTYMYTRQGECRNGNHPHQHTGWEQKVNSKEAYIPQHVFEEIASSYCTSPVQLYRKLHQVTVHRVSPCTLVYITFVQDGSYMLV